MVYVPERPPNIQTLDELMEYVQRELQSISKESLETQTLELRPTFTAPLRPREGMIVYADGTEFNPQFAGKGPHVYDGTRWIALGFTYGTFTPVVSFDVPGDLNVGTPTARGSWWRMGDFVFYAFYYATLSFSHSTASGSLRIQGFPFQPRGGDVANTLEQPLQSDGIAPPEGTIQLTLHTGGGGSNTLFVITSAPTSGGQFIQASHVTAGILGLTATGFYIATIE